MNFDVSVIIPTYNRAGLIGEAIASVLAQTHRAAEIIVVDDGSTDNTEQVVRDGYPGVRYFRIPNSGECGARNAGAVRATSPWLAFLDSDDVWAPTKLDMHARLLQRAPDVRYSFSNFTTIIDGVWSQESKFSRAPLDYFTGSYREVGRGLARWDEPLCGRLLNYQPIFPSTLVMTRTFFYDVGCWKEELGRIRSVDLEFHLRCVRRPPIGVVTHPVAGIRKHANNFSSDTLVTTLGEITILEYVLEHHAVARDYREAIEEQIIKRRMNAADAAFARSDLRTVHALLADIPRRLLTRRLRVKAGIAGLPRQAARAACNGALALNSIARLGRLGRRTR